MTDSNREAFHHWWHNEANIRMSDIGENEAWYIWQAATAHANRWYPISEAPKDETPVDLLRDGERLPNYVRFDLGDGNVFYNPIESGELCVRDATHFYLPPGPPK